jgi:hypothetical protein
VTQSRRNRWIMGSAIGLAALATAIDHTRHQVPAPIAKQTTAQQPAQEAAPCGLGGNSEEPSVSPCSLE